MEVKRLRTYDSDDRIDSEDVPPTPLTTKGRERAPDPILRMTAKFCRNDENVTYLQIKSKLVKAFGYDAFREKKKDIVRLLRWRKEVLDHGRVEQEEASYVAPDAIWKSGTSLIDSVIDPEISPGPERVEGLHTNAPLSHSFKYLRKQSLGHEFLLVRVIRARGLMSKGARSVVKASNPCCTVRVGQCYGETETVETSNEPQWGRQFTFPFDRLSNPFAVIEVMHKGSMGTSRFLGRCVVPLTCMQPGRSVLRWYNLRKRGKKSHVSGSIQVQCICSPPMDDTVSHLFREVCSQASLYLSCVSDVNDDGVEEEKETSSLTTKTNSKGRPPSYTLRLRNEASGSTSSSSDSVSSRTIATDVAKAVKALEPVSPPSTTRTPNVSFRACRMCSKPLRMQKSPSLTNASFDVKQFCTLQCSLFFTAVESKGFTVRTQVGGDLSICTDETDIMRRTRELLKQSLNVEKDALIERSDGRAGKGMAPSKWIHHYSDLHERLVGQFGQQAVRDEDDLVESEWHAFESARRRSRFLRTARNGAPDLMRNVKSLPPPWEQVEVVLRSVNVCSRLLPSRDPIPMNDWMSGFLILTDWRMVFVETESSNLASSSEAMSRALDKLNNSDMSFEEFHLLFTRTCARKSLKMLQVPIGCAKSVKSSEITEDGRKYRVLTISCSDMRTLYVQCPLELPSSAIEENVDDDIQRERVRSNTMDSISALTSAHQRIESDRLHRTLETPEKSRSVRRDAQEVLDRALEAATKQAEYDSSDHSSVPVEIATVVAVDDKDIFSMYDQQNFLLLRAIDERLNLRIVNAIEERRMAATRFSGRMFETFTRHGRLWDSPYDFHREMRRLRLPNRFWRTTKANQNYELCDTYPAMLIVPRKINDDALHQASKYRSRERIPTLCWRHRVSGAAMLRSSQPCSGLAGNYSDHDERLVETAHAANPANVKKKLMIIDARPLLNAVANQMKGKGYEVVNESHYTCCDPVHFMNIGNIHVMRKSLASLLADCESMIRGHSSDLEGMDAWFGHVGRVLEAATKIAKMMHIGGHSTLVHCSDGWDRTPQLTSLAQLMMDSYYRTWEGFQVLIAKEWISFGHKFAQRCGRTKGSHEESPIFLQFCDCVFQCLSQFPTAFEFNSQYLAWIVRHTFSNWFGNFLADNEKVNKIELCNQNGSISIWSVANANKKQFLNPRYVPSSGNDFVLLPSFDLSQVRTNNDLSSVSAGASLRCHCGDLVLWSDCYMYHTEWIMTDTPHQFVVDPVSGITKHVKATVLGV